MNIRVTRKNVFPLTGSLGLEGLVRSAVHPKSVNFSPAGEDALIVSGPELDETDVELINVAGFQEKRHARFSAVQATTEASVYLQQPGSPFPGLRVPMRHRDDVQDAHVLKE